jgi:hypothetical protein
VIIVLASLVGVWGLSSTRTSVMRAAGYRGAMKIQYDAETGLQQAVQRIQAIADPTRDDPIGDLTLDDLLDPAKLPPADETATPDCPEDLFDPRRDLDDPRPPAAGGALGPVSNTICNFMGTALRNTQTVLVRRPDFVEGSNQSAVLLLVVTTKDPAGRRRRVHGVVVVPYDGGPGAYALPQGRSPYLATVVRTGP